MPETAERRMIMDDMEIFRKLAQCEDKEQMQRCIEDYNNSQKPPTNADRIRAMSDEELADWISRTQVSNVAEAFEVIGYVWKQPDNLKDGVKKECLEWLRQPAEVSGDA